ncbi:sel1 repeat family protein [Vibrio viridaestus]|uniref:Sel1 repeat family protein n=1 Tax=Vibrio viridaestus TaxID=2487322 RepID=A0A3N9TMF4_9VIBR|nr:sel1 repeat family protein [Vibrio viridaestus]
MERNLELERQDRLKKAEEGHIPTILYMAKEAERRDWRESFYWYEKAANLDNITGMYGVVRLSKRFEGDIIMMEKSKFWQTYIKGLEGDNVALFETGRALIQGLGVSANVDKGINIIEKSALANFIPAQIYLGDWCISKDNPTPKPEDSTYWYTKAAKLENLEAMMKLGLNYLKGVGVVKDHRRACYWLESAAELGYPEAMYFSGKAWIDFGQEGNSIAYIWLFLAAHFGYEPAKTLRDEVGNKVGVDSIVMLQRFAKPLMKKIQSGTIGRHIIIRAFNKLYKRDVPIPTTTEFLEDEVVYDNSNELLDEMTMQNMDFSQEMKSREDDSVETSTPKGDTTAQ